MFDLPNTSENCPDLAMRFCVKRPAFALNIDLVLPGRGLIGLFGPSGSGKTTLLRCIAGLEQTTEGKLIVDQQPWQDSHTWVPVYKRSIGYVFHDSCLFPHLTIQQNLLYGQKRRTQDSSLSPLLEIAEHINIQHLLQAKPGQISTGEKQRVAIARALLTRPRILLMDEPLAAQDSDNRQQIIDYLERFIKAHRIAVFYISHTPDEIQHLVKHTILLNNGHIS